MTHNLNNNFIGVEVPEGIGKVNRFKVNHNLLQCFNSRREWITDILLPSPDYTFCFLYPDGVTEEWARQIDLSGLDKSKKYAVLKSK